SPAAGRVPPAIAKLTDWPDEQTERLPAEREDRPAPRADRFPGTGSASAGGSQDKAREEAGEGRRRGGEGSGGFEAALGSAGQPSDARSRARRAAGQWRGQDPRLARAQRRAEAEEEERSRDSRPVLNRFDLRGSGSSRWPRSHHSPARPIGSR